MSSTLEVRQAAVNERRHWVRLTRACNNRCRFCLDSGSHDGLAIPEDEIQRKILQGREKGATRLILSGGEASIHPKFVDFIKFGRDNGYTWIQTITNGRMFSYERFAARAVAAGLREATFSLHAHTPELYEALVGSKGAWPQALGGLKNALRFGMVVSVDIVLTRLNLPFLKEILQYYMDLGVFEFDLLHLVPFGRGFDEFRDELYPDPDLVKREMARALELADTPGLYLWTNRLPIEYLEGREDLFQDPHKIHDEVLGEREAFRELFAKGTDPECVGERCPHCFLRPFCEAARDYAKMGTGRAEMGTDTISCEHEMVSVPIFAEHLNDETGDEPVEATREFCRQAATWSDDELRERVPGGIRVPLREDLVEAMAAAPDPADLLALARRVGSPIEDLPPCLGGPGDGGERRPALEDAVRGPDGKPDLARFVGFFIRRVYRVKSLRCRECTMDAHCPGLHVNLARAWGLKVLQPSVVRGPESGVREPSEAPVPAVPTASEDPRPQTTDN